MARWVCLDAYIAMIPKADGDATPLGQRPLSVLPVVYRLQLGFCSYECSLKDWFKSWVPRFSFQCWGWSWVGGGMVHHCS